MSKARQLLMQDEDAECIVLCDWLDWRKIDYCHIPNGGKRGKAEAARFKRLGVKAGMPDYLIFTPPPLLKNELTATGEHCKGVALEMKRADGGKLSQAQKKQLAMLAKHGWYTFVAHGSDPAIERLTKLGY